MNYTLIYLAQTSCLQHSPLLTISGSSSFQSLSFSRFFLSYSLSPIFRSINRHQRAKFEHGTLTNFLSSAIATEKTQFLINQIYEFTQQSFMDDDLMINDCIFRDYKLPDKEGAAIYIAHSVDLYNVIFQNIDSFYGAIYTTEGIKAKYVSFVNVSAMNAACFVSDNQNSLKLNNAVIDSILVMTSKSAMTGAIIHKGVGDFNLTNSNLTNCRSNEINGCFALTNQNVYIKSTIFDKFTADSASVGTMEKTKKFSIILSTFKNMKSRSIIETSEIDAGEIKDCLFVSIVINQGAVLIAHDKKSLFSIANNCFDSLKNDEIYKIKGMKPVELENIYQTKCNYFSINNNVGYSYRRTPTYAYNHHIFNESNQQVEIPTPSEHYSGSYFESVLIEIDIFIMITRVMLGIALLAIIMILLCSYKNRIFKRLKTSVQVKNRREML
ncbi:hypothetical protein TRFO_10000 [Tritrichomonas foetus]|uniref:Right handed beta helix domain-containing protein n=1 Tax=Tritrichomonas foetus TaxID=1144522 RepID=A0A1J4JAZ5_9EUKA|nr:hypothetical protein TRFO_10000 [Tritrichomonas foetus]|eukprot:OHS96350.1 hypothetical protein TRFO_10000 [Tritrichomonas foetus]